MYPNLLQRLIDNAIIPGDFGKVPALALTVLGVVIVKGFMQFLHGFFGGRLGNYLAYRLRNACYEKLQFLSFRYYDTAKMGDLEAIRNFIGFGFAQLLNVVLMVVFGSMMMLYINWQLTLFTMISMPLLLFVTFKFESRIHPTFQEMRIALSALTTAVQENITGVRTVKSFARESYEVEKFSVRNEQYKSNQIQAASLWSRFFPAMELIASVSVVLLLAMGAIWLLKSR